MSHCTNTYCSEDTEILKEMIIKNNENTKNSSSVDIFLDSHHELSSIKIHIPVKGMLSSSASTI